jgi:hypothetical protein
LVVASSKELFFISSPFLHLLLCFSSSLLISCSRLLFFSFSFANPQTVSASSSDTPRYNRVHTPSGIARNRSSSPAQLLANIQPQTRQTETVEHITKEDGTTAIVTTIRSVCLLDVF